jgi:hypothetical protein
MTYIDVRDIKIEWPKCRKETHAEQWVVKEDKQNEGTITFNTIVAPAGNYKRMGPGSLQTCRSCCGPFWRCGARGHGASGKCC